MDENIFYDEFLNKLQVMENALIDAQNNEADIDEIFRAIHTIKGTADLLGLYDIVNITHKTEDLLDRIRTGDISLNNHILKLLIELKDFIALMIKNSLEGIDDDHGLVTNLTIYFEKQIALKISEKDVEIRNTILVVDDSIIVRESLKALARESGYHSFSSPNGNDGLLKIQMYNIELIFCDISVKEIEGLAMIKNIQENPHYHNIPVIMLISENDPNFKTRTKELKSDAWLSKPVDENKFLMILEMFFG